MITMQGVTPCWLRSPSVASKYDRERLCTWVTAERAVTYLAIHLSSEALSVSPAARRTL